MEPSGSTEAAGDARKNIVVTLVHGTWGAGTRVRKFFRRSPSWFEEGSEFTARLRNALGVEAASVSIAPFYWSGANSISARYDAARRLAKQYRTVLAQHPNAIHVVVGHSHGGSVAALAAKLGARFTRKTTNIVLVTLATPFFQIEKNCQPSKRRRSIESAIDKNSFAFVIIAMLLVHFFVSAAPSGRKQIDNHSIFGREDIISGANNKNYTQNQCNIGSIREYIQCDMQNKNSDEADKYKLRELSLSEFWNDVNIQRGIAFIIATMIVSVIRTQIPPQVEEDQYDKAANLAYMTSGGMNVDEVESVVVIRGVDDEATLALAAGSIGNRLSYLAMSAALNGMRYIIAAAFLLALISAVWMYYYDNLSSLAASKRFDVQQVLLTCSNIILLILLMCPVFALLGAICKSAFGTDLLTGCFFCEVASNTVPDTSRNMKIVTLPKSTDGRLRHGLHANPEVPKIISEIISNKTAHSQK